jgi:hypothetical protein
MAFQSFAAQYLGSQDAVTDIRLRTVALYCRSIYLYNANVVQQGGLFDESFIDIPFRMPMNDF